MWPSLACILVYTGIIVISLIARHQTPGPGKCSSRKTLGDLGSTGLINGVKEQNLYWNHIFKIIQGEFPSLLLSESEDQQDSPFLSFGVVWSTYCTVKIRTLWWTELPACYSPLCLCQSAQFSCTKDVDSFCAKTPPADSRFDLKVWRFISTFLSRRTGWVADCPSQLLITVTRCGAAGTERPDAGTTTMVLQRRDGGGPRTPDVHPAAGKCKWDCDTDPWISYLQLWLLWCYWQAVPGLQRPGVWSSWFWILWQTGGLHLLSGRPGRTDSGTLETTGDQVNI